MVSFAIEQTCFPSSTDRLEETINALPSNNIHSPNDCSTLVTTTVDIYMYSSSVD